MRIGFDAKRAFLNKSGLGNYSRNTLNALSDFYPQIQKYLFTTDTGSSFACESCKVFTPPSYYPRFLRFYWRYNTTKKLFKDNKIDIYHGLSNELPHNIRRLGVKSVVTIHDLVVLKHPEHYSLIDREIYLSKVRFACENANKIIAISKQTKGDILRHFRIKPEKIEIIQQSISDVFFQDTTNEDIPAKFGVQKDYILSVGTIENRKNQLSLLQAVVKNNIKNQIVFVGKKGSYYKVLNDFIQENGLSKQVLFLSDIKEKELKTLYEKALFSSYISTYEGFGLPIIESMACGCPVITSNTSCMPDTAGNAALLCNPYDINDVAQKVQQLTTSSELRKKMREKGIKRANNFKSEHYANRLYGIYSKIIAK